MLSSERDEAYVKSFDPDSASAALIVHVAVGDTCRRFCRRLRAQPVSELLAFEP